MTEPPAFSQPMVNFLPFGPQFAQPVISPEQAFKLAVGNPQIPKYYVTHFTTVVAPTEMSLLLGYYGAPVGIWSISYPVAKTLASKLNEAIQEYEANTGLTVVDSETVGKNFPQT